MGRNDFLPDTLIKGRSRYNSFTYPDGAGWKLDAKERSADKKGIVRVNLKLTKREGICASVVTRRRGKWLKPASPKWHGGWLMGFLVP